MQSRDLRERSYQFSIDLFQLIARTPKNVSFNVINNQLLRCGTSIGANIIEAEASSSRKDFINYYHIALKSAHKTKYWLGLLKDALSFNDQGLEHINLEVSEISKMLNASLLTLKKKN